MHAPLWVKIGMGLGFSFLALTVIDMFGSYIFHSGEAEQHAAVTDSHEPDSPGHGAATSGETFDLAGALAAASGNEGSVKKCTACHTFGKGGAQRIGPNLWDIVGREKASVEGFSYSGALKGLGGTWTFEELFAFLSSPKTFAPGSKMTFAGFKKPNQAVDTISYLHSLSDTPVALPAATTEVADHGSETADEEEPAAEEADPHAEADHGVEEAATEDVSEEVVEDTVDGTTTEATETAPEAVDVVEEVVEEAEEAVDTAAATSRFAEANIESGIKVFKKCKTCHTPESGGANKIGPNLWNIMGRAKATVEGFRYSAPMTSAGGSWTVEDMDMFLTNPKAMVSGTKMSFPGLKKESDRTNVIAYLASLSDAPIELE